MCTLSWSITGDARTLCFNRDERRSRAEALPPATQTRGGRRILAPVDPDGGGTWLGVNECGLVVALLNFYPKAQAERAGERSRGLLVMDALAECRGAGEVGAWLRSADLKVYRGFICFAMGRADEPMARRWDGDGLEALDLSDGMLSTSSVRDEACRRYRSARLAGAASPDALRAAHLHVCPDDPALGPLVVREDARTHSVSEIRLERGAARFTYSPVDPQTPRLIASFESTLPLIP